MQETFKTAGKILFDGGMNDSHSGNASIKDGDKIVITSRKAMFSMLKDTDLVETGLEPVSSDADASRDLDVHRAIYKNIGAKAILHAHPAYAMSLCLTENKILPQDQKTQGFFPQGVSIVKLRPGFDRAEFIRLVVPMISTFPGIVMVKGYGSFAVAGSLEEALELTTSLEMTSKAWLYSKLVSPRPLPMSNQHQSSRPFEPRKRTAIPPGIGVMGSRSGYRRDNNKR